MNNYSSSPDQSADTCLHNSLDMGSNIYFCWFLGIITPGHRLNFPFMTFTEKRLLSGCYHKIQPGAAVMVDLEELSPICSGISAAQASNHCALDV